MYKAIFKGLKALSFAEATVLTFITASLIGGWCLWITEGNREVKAKLPVHQEFKLTPVFDSQSSNLEAESRNEVHTHLKDITYKGEKFVDTWFTAVSALCVTGLISTDFSEFTLVGQIITLILIQMGGLGVILFTSIIAMSFIRGISEDKDFKTVLSGILDTSDDSVKRMIRHVIIYTAIFEIGGFLIMGFHLQFLADKSLLNGINPWWWSFFHSISAFNNAGFGLMNNNLINFVKDPVINLVISTLIIVGGLGYAVLIAIHAFFHKMFAKFHRKETKDLERDVQDVVASPVQTAIAITGTIFLLIIGTVIPLFLENQSPLFADYNSYEKLQISFFQSVSTRTAGFNTIDIGSLGLGTIFLYIVLMYIGANPGGTAGGVKIPTIAVLYGYVKDWFSKPGEPVILYGKRISKFAVSHSIRLFFFSIIFIGLMIFFICIAENKFLITPDPIFNFQKITFEVVSAFGTVGLSMGFAGGVTSLTAIFTSFSKVMIILTMFFGRIGPLVILAALPWKKKFANEPLSEDFNNVEKLQIG